MTLELDSVSHRYGGDLAVDDVSFGVDPGELVGVVGPSGCGKTTLVRAIAGHLHPTAGRVLLRGRDVTGDPPESRRIGLGFQESTLYPHMTVAENVAYGVAARDDGPERREGVVSEHLELVGLADEREAYPGSLSGGQRRRVELARALAPEPDLLVLDEPLSALDRALRTRLREEIDRLHRETGVTTLFVTHDQTDALALSDRLVVMARGRVAAVGTPRELYESPPTPFVASFLGRSTVVRGRLVGTSPPRVAIGDTELTVEGGNTDRSVGETVTCHARPRRLSVRSDDGTASDGDGTASDGDGTASDGDGTASDGNGTASDGNGTASDGNGTASDGDGTASDDGASSQSLRGEVLAVEDAGRRYNVRVAVASDEELLIERTAAPPSVGESVAVDFPDGSVTLFGTDFEASGDPEGGTAATPPVRRD
ncbi:hypothetical protein GCM10008995_06190 [Halobellus salinus]|uniref:Molybdate/tungstate import ATP-binding protein WtpC n=1 Tax=Halobellus salinus TaxID=931585 RepID=A0A830EDA0_9EURY|nr:ATP-binding cassette domain-containing protein [Halobellus salinus]GGI99086.1 hypothetical protein GCM10008995_06190 [Halobellus salinus]SMP05103.1 molybdate/tungstate transport system ATP-binding protein [Halobellus salinus]